MLVTVMFFLMLVHAGPSDAQMPAVAKGEPMLKPEVDPEDIIFDSQMLVQGSNGGGIDTSRFEKANLILAGRYRLDMLVNGHWRGVQNIELRNVHGQQNAHVCYDRALLERVGIDLVRSATVRSPCQKV